MTNLRESWLDQFRHDIVYGARMLLRAPGFTVSALSVLALGIGINLAIIHILNAAIFNRLSVRDASSIVAFERSGRFPYAMVEFFSKRNTAYSWMITERTGVSLFLDNDPEPLRSTFVSPNYFSALGINPREGRVFDERDAGGGAQPVVVLSHRYWQNRFNSDKGAVGRVIRLNGKPVEVIGVAPPEFTGLTSRPASAQAALWLPIAAHPSLFMGSMALTNFGQRDTDLYAALRPGVPLESANVQLVSLVEELRKSFPDQIRMRPGEAGTGRHLLSVSPEALAPILLVAALFFVVLIAACANLGNLLLARGQARMREISIRAAVGASPSRLIRQLMAESLLLGFLGAAAGLGVGYVSAKGLLYLMEAPPDLNVVTDWRMVIAGGALAVISAILFGLAPARHAVRTLSAGAARNDATRTRQVLIALQVATSCFLLILASLLARSIQRQFAIDVRFDYENMVVVDPQLHAHNLPPAAARAALNTMTERLSQVPGVNSVTATLSLPFSSRKFVETRPGLPRTDYHRVASAYFDVMNLPLVRGRLFMTNEQNVVVLSESAVAAIWPGQNPLGKVLDVSHFNSDSIENGRTHVNGTDRRLVIGVVKNSGSTLENTVEGYLPLEDSDLANALILMRTNGQPARIAQEARAAASLQGLAPSSWLVRTSLDQNAGRQRGVVLGVGALGTTAALLAAFGIFGLITFSVAQRTREIGIRVALGARWHHVFSCLVSRFARAMFAGALAGIIGSALAARAIQSQIFGMDSLDPASYIVPLASFAAVALIAILVPMRHASRIDPATAVRWD